MSKRDYYDVLGVEKNADDKAIKAAFRKLAMANHPDRNQGNGAAEGRFREANEAYAKPMQTNATKCNTNATPMQTNANQCNTNANKTNRCKPMPTNTKPMQQMQKCMQGGR